MSTGIRNANWYNRNESRSWPLDETATLYDDDGQPFPQDILTDLHLLFPRSLGYRAFLGGVTVTDRLVTLTILAAGTSFRPVAAISLLQPADLYRQHAMEPLLAGVAGWVTFGQGVEVRRGAWRFSNASQSLLMAKRARSYGDPPVASIGKLGLEPGLLGVVRWSGGNDVEIVKGERDIAGAVREVAVFRLRNKTDDQRNVLDVYTGPCGARPESGNCDGPPPIETINTVTPDCEGNIFVEFRGCGELLGMVGSDDCGVVIDCGFGLSEACVSPDRMPDEAGRLPGEYDDDCDPDTTSSTTTTTQAPSNYDPQPATDPLLLPYTETFDQPLVEAGITVVSNGFTLLATGGGVYGERRGGNVDRIQNSGGKALFIFERASRLQVGDRFVVLGSDQNNYNRPHTVTAVYNRGGRVLTSTNYTVNGVGGAWSYLGNAAGPGVGGGHVGSVVAGTKDLGSGGLLLTFGETHNLVLGSTITLAATQQPIYNGDHTVVEVKSPTAVVIGVAHSIDTNGGVWTHRGNDTGGRITSISAHGSGRAKITFAAAPSLSTGDRLTLLGNSVAGLNRTCFVQKMLSATEWLTDLPYTGATGNGGLWKIVGYTDATPQSGVCRSTTAGRALLIWTDGLPEQPTWSSWRMRAKLLFAMLAGPSGTNTNGGLVFNYRDQQNYWLAEVDWSAERTLRLWQAQDGSFTLLASTTLSSLTLQATYQLTVDVLPYNATGSSAYVAVRLSGVEDDVVATLGPLEVPDYTPATGLLGCHANRAITNFDDLTVTFLNP